MVRDETCGGREDGTPLPHETPPGVKPVMKFFASPGTRPGMAASRVVVARPMGRRGGPACWIAVAALGMVGVARAQADEDPIAACDLAEVRLAFGVDDRSGWEVACEPGLQVAVRVDVDDEGRVRGTLLWHDAGGWGITSLDALVPRTEGRLSSDLWDVRFLPPIEGFRRLSVVTGAGEDASHRVEHQLWLRPNGGGPDPRGRTLVAVFVANHSERDSGADCLDAWIVDLRLTGRTIARRYTYEPVFDGDDPALRARCLARRRRRAADTVRGHTVRLPRRGEGWPETIPGFEE